MMWRSVAMCLLTCLLMAGTSVMVAAQDGAEGSADERYQVPDTDIAISFPPDCSGA